MARRLLASSVSYPPTQQILSNNSLICYLQAVSIDVWLNAKKEKDTAATSQQRYCFTGSQTTTCEPSEPKSDKPTLKEVYRILVSIQGTVATLLAENSKISVDIIELKSTIARSNTEVNKLKEDFNNQCKYVILHRISSIMVMTRAHAHI